MRWTEFKKSSPSEPISSAKVFNECAMSSVVVSFVDISLLLACNAFLRGIRIMVPWKECCHSVLMSEKQRSWFVIASSVAETGKSYSGPPGGSKPRDHE